MQTLNHWWRGRPAGYFRSKTVAGLLACFFGAFALQGWYLRRPLAPVITLISIGILLLSFTQPVWWDSIPFFFLFIPIWMGFIESAVYCLVSDEKFDARFNTNQKRLKPSGAWAGLVALLNLLVAGMVSMFTLSMVVAHVVCLEMTC